VCCQSEYAFTVQLLLLRDTKLHRVLAEKGMFSSKPNPRVGCVIVNDNKIIGEGWHRKTGEDHAEIIAIKEAPKAPMI
jgi:pyrimidine deaminase RibD-like protein